MYAGGMRCRLKPPLEELKTNYYKEIKNFINLPLTFRGLEGAHYIYKCMPDRNTDSLQHVFEKAENLFERLQKLQDTQFEKYLVREIIS
jgi:dynein heavy chain 2, cytosolic